MDKAGFLIERHLKEGVPIGKLAKDHGLHRSWLYKLFARYREEGEAGLAPRSRRPQRSPTRICDLYEDEIVALRKELTDGGFDAGAETIFDHLKRRHRDVPSVSTIWRVLKARGFVTPQPHKRPRSSYVRFAAELPNECWQMDTTHVYLDDGSDVEILNVIDDHSRLCVAATVKRVYKGTDVVTVFRSSAERFGYPQSVLSDNGAVFMAEYRFGVGALEAELAGAGIEFKHSRPYHPQTCGKVERFHQTMKKYLEKRDAQRSVRGLQAQVDTFVAYYNEVRPHRAIGRKTPAEAFAARTKAHPLLPSAPDGYRLRRDRVDKGGKVTLRYSGRLHHIGVGREHIGKEILLFVAGVDVRIVDANGELIRRLELDPTRNYQRQI